LSWTKHQFDEINNGKEFWAKYDRRHDLSLVVIYNPTKRITLSGVWVYGSGEAITLPLATYHQESNVFLGIDATQSSGLTDYGNRNESRMKSYHRLDLSIQVHKQVRWGERTWEFGVYNAYSRKNPFFYFIGENYDATSGIYYPALKQFSLFPLIPSISYSIKF
jgi:hypothetical protein